MPLHTYYIPTVTVVFYDLVIHIIYTFFKHVLHERMSAHVFLLLKNDIHCSYRSNMIAPVLSSRHSNIYEIGVQHEDVRVWSKQDYIVN